MQERKVSQAPDLFSSAEMGRSSLTTASSWPH